MTRLPTKEEWDAWRSLPATQTLQQVAVLRKQRLMEAWASGAFADSVSLNMKALGECQAYQMLEDLDFESVVTGELDDEHKPTAGANAPV